MHKAFCFAVLQYFVISVENGLFVMFKLDWSSVCCMHCL